MRAQESGLDFTCEQHSPHPLIFAELDSKLLQLINSNKETLAIHDFDDAQDA